MDKRSAMEAEGMKRGAKKRPVTDEALEELQKMVDATDLHAIESRRSPPPNEEEPEAMMAPEDCEACKSGECTDPEHNEDAVREMMDGMGGD